MLTCSAYGTGVCIPLPLALRTTSRGRGRNTGLTASASTAACSHTSVWTVVILSEASHWRHAALCTVQLAGWLLHPFSKLWPSRKHQWVPQTLSGHLRTLSLPEQVLALGQPRTHAREHDGIWQRGHRGPAQALREDTTDAGERDLDEGDEQRWDQQPQSCNPDGTLKAYQRKGQQLNTATVAAGAADSSQVRISSKAIRRKNSCQKGGRYTWACDDQTQAVSGTSRTSTQKPSWLNLVNTCVTDVAESVKPARISGKGQPKCQVFHFGSGLSGRSASGPADPEESCARAIIRTPSSEN